MTQTVHATDSQIKDAVLDELSWTPNIDSTHVGVSVLHGAVTLSGEAATFPEKHHAAEAALRVRGVTAVADEMTVDNDYAAQTSDSDIVRSASAALQGAVDLPAGAVQAVVHDRVVTLSGQVVWQYQRMAAARAVRYLRGVRDVVNNISIRPTASTAGIRTSITAALVRSAMFEGRKTDVAVNATGRVTLNGTVHSAAERQTATDAAWSAPGVTDVVNLMTITTSGQEKQPGSWAD